MEVNRTPNILITLRKAKEAARVDFSLNLFRYSLCFACSNAVIVSNPDAGKAFARVWSWKGTSFYLSRHCVVFGLPDYYSCWWWYEEVIAKLAVKFQYIDISLLLKHKWLLLLEKWNEAMVWWWICRHVALFEDQLTLDHSGKFAFLVLKRI